MCTKDVTKCAVYSLVICWKLFVCSRGKRRHIALRLLVSNKDQESFYVTAMPQVISIRLLEMIRMNHDLVGY